MAPASTIPEQEPLSVRIWLYFMIAGGFMERMVHRASSHDEARAWDIQQHVGMTPEERLRAARLLKDRAYPQDSKDVRECHPSG